MKKALFFVFLFISYLVQAQNPQVLKKVLELKMPKTAEDSMPGKRGASVAWHPGQKKYYAVFAGNSAYPLGVFDATGRRLSSVEQTAMLDTRGLWYDPESKLIGGNGYDDYGWFSYELSDKGMPTDYKEEQEGMNQPDKQSVGAYNSATKEVMFIYGGLLFKYDKDAELKDSLMIHWGRKKADGPGDNEDPYTSPRDYNFTTVIYTGIKGQELGFLNITNKYVELYDINTGYLTKTLALPETSTPVASFNFAYANGIYWVFDMDARIWNGYK